jgi:F-type H+-transporting ATPase subunit gamma
MSRRRDIDIHRYSLDEIREIMNSMKNLSYMETRKISTFLDVQHTMVKHIETVASDFLVHYPETLSEHTGKGGADVNLLIGAERGFCGDFNHTLIRRFETIPQNNNSVHQQTICIGHKLGTLLEGDTREILFIDGASVADEVDNVLNRLVSELVTIQRQYGTLNLHVLYHADERQLIKQQLLPPFQDLRNDSGLHGSVRGYPPMLNLTPEKFLLELSYQYLFIVLYEILYTSLMAECRQRVSHLEGAIRHLEEQSAELLRQSNSLRQEEIIEEIEVILLNQTT